MRPVRSKIPPRTPGVVGSAISRIRRMNSGQTETEEVSVFCRVRPLISGATSDVSDSSSDVSDVGQRCIEVLNDETVRLIPPVNSRAYYNGKTQEYSFKSIFGEESTQTEVFQRCGLPLVNNLLNGKNGLLFTYGITGSGKTYTMQGIPSDGGIMTRTIDVIFNSLGEYLTSKKYMIEPDKLNDFQLQSVTDAALREQKESNMRLNTAYNTRSNTSDPDISKRLPDETTIEIDQNCVYAVFISYCEVYNKYIYDLLDDSRDRITRRLKFESKSLREDAHGHMFVYGVAEKEVRSAKEALELFYKGQKRRRVAQTLLNLESSRSHSVFNIRVVKCHSTDRDEVDPSRSILVSQLALVDLAGSERTSRTGNTGVRLKEAGNINQSLMALRACIEKLRENQKSSTKSQVPYRNDKITHLFRNYFEGIGSIKMVVCINPKSSDYDETLNVMKFAELTKEVEIERIDPMSRDIGVTPCRKWTSQFYDGDALNRQETDVDVNKLNKPYCPIYSLGPPMPTMEWQGFDDTETIPTLLRHLEQKVATRNTLIEHHKGELENCRKNVVELEKGDIIKTEEIKRLKLGLETANKRIRDLEARLVNAEAANNSLQRRQEAYSEFNDQENEMNMQNKQQGHNRSQTSCHEQEKQPYHLRRSKSKRSYEEATEAVNGNDLVDQDFKNVGARIAEWRARHDNDGIHSSPPASRKKKF